MPSPPFTTTFAADLEYMDLQDVGYSGGSLIGYTTPGCSDGQYRYLSPTDTGGYNSDHGRAVRYPINNFTTPHVEVLDLNAWGCANGWCGGEGSQLQGFTGCFVAGGKVYYAPYSARSGSLYLVVRVSTSDWSGNTIEVLDMRGPGSCCSDAGGMKNGFSDGTYGYFWPDSTNTATNRGKIYRFSLSTFDSASVQVLDVEGANGGSQHGSSRTPPMFDGAFAWFAPHHSTTGEVLRIDPSAFSTSGVTKLNLNAIDPNVFNGIGGYALNTGAVLDPTGTYLYVASGKPGVTTDGTSTVAKLARIPTAAFGPAGTATGDASQIATVDIAALDSSGTHPYALAIDGPYLYWVSCHGHDWAQKAMLSRMRVTAFDETTPSIDQFDFLTDVSQGPYLRCASSLGIDGSYAYIMGGWSDTTSGTPSDKVGKIFRFPVTPHTPMLPYRPGP